MMMAFLYRVMALIKKEFITILKDPKSKGIIVGLPIMQLLIFSNAATMEVRNIDVTVLDRSQSAESRELLSRFEFSPHFRKFYFVDSEADFRKNLDTQRVQIGISIPGDFARKIKNMEKTQVLVASDGRQTNSAAIAAGYASQIISSYNNEFIRGQKAAVTASVRNWFNPNLEYKWYILTAIVAMLSLVSTLILTALSIAREREQETFDQLIVSPLSSFEILLGKSVPPMVIAMALTSIMVGILFVFFKVPFAGSVVLFFISIFISLLAIVGVGLLISAICNTQQQAILTTMSFIMPAVLLSGFISPIEDMPVFLQYLTYINPVRFFMALTRGLILKGMGFEDVLKNVIPLLIIAISTLTTASLTFKRKLG